MGDAILGGRVGKTADRRNILGKHLGERSPPTFNARNPRSGSRLEIHQRSTSSEGSGGVTVHLLRGELKDASHSSEIIDFKCDHKLTNNEEDEYGMFGLLDRIVNFDLFKSYQMEQPPQFFGYDPLAETDN